MKKLLYILFISLSSSGSIYAYENAIYSQNLPTNDSFELIINDQLEVKVTRFEDRIITNHLFSNNNITFQIEFHFDNEELYYFRIINTKELINKTFSVKRIKKNGYGYRSITADYDVDFFFPREKNENFDIVLAQFSKNPNFEDREYFINYAEALYDRIATYLVVEIGTVDFFGEVVSNQKIDALYYKFDNEIYSPAQKIKISSSGFNHKSKKYNNKYHTTFTRKQLHKSSRIYFSSSSKDVIDTILKHQNSIDLISLRASMKKFIYMDDVAINNDLFVDEKWEQIITRNKSVLPEEKKYIGTYGINTSNDQTKFELKDNYQYYSKDGDNERFGFWKLSKRHNIDAIMVYDIYIKNDKVGNITKPVDFGSSFEILTNNEKLMYPMGSEMYTEAKKIK